MGQCAMRVKELDGNVASLTGKVNELGNCSRRNNLLVFGMSEPKNESNELLKDAVLKCVFKEKLSVKRIHRLGRKCNDKSRPVVLQLIDINGKTQLMRCSAKLRGMTTWKRV